MPDHAPTEELEVRLDEDEARLVEDEARLARDEQRLLADEVRLEAEEAEIRESRLVSWLGFALAIVLAIAVAALVVALAGLRGDVGAISASAPQNSVGTSAIRNGSVTADKLAPHAVGPAAVADSSIGHDQLAVNAVSGAQVAQNSLTGADIRESALGSVPLARNAGHLGGLPPHAYLSQVFRVSTTSLTDARSIKGPLTARCPEASQVISGGAAIAGAAHGASLVDSAPEGSDGWTATARVARRDRPAWKLVVTAICATGGD